MTDAAKAYEEMSNKELIDFVAAKLPSLLWRIEKKPRCYLCRDAVISALAIHGEAARIQSH